VQAIVRGRVRAEVLPGNAQITANTEVAAERRYDAVEIIRSIPTAFLRPDAPEPPQRYMALRMGQPVVPGMLGQPATRLQQPLKRSQDAYGSSALMSPQSRSNVQMATDIAAYRVPSADSSGLCDARAMR